MKKLILLLILLLIVLIFFVGCEREVCIKDEDCVVSGCNKEICANRPLTSICVWKPEYECLTSCKCINFRCQWENTTQYYECLELNKGKKISNVS